MTIPSSSFSGMSPDAYDSGLGPMFFEPRAADIARRVQPGAHASVLEIAAGTGIVTRHLLQRLPPDARLIVTDINEAMLAVAKAKLPCERQGLPRSLAIRWTSPAKVSRRKPPRTGWCLERRC